MIELLPTEKYEPVIGLEVHAQLKTNTKIFCSCSTGYPAPPNSNVCPVCLGHPGVLPVLNESAVEFAIKLGIALNSRVNLRSIFARKNYFYPDLPKGYQISQFSLPVVGEGELEITLEDGTKKKIGVTRAHLEEDAGKSIHDRGDSTLVDLNRSGVPLLEIVSHPDIRSGAEAASYLRTLRQILLYLDICDGNMEEGSLRCDANISVRLRGETRFGTKTEVKNMNSFKNVEKAINFEIARQIDLLEEGREVVQQTLLWNADKGTASPMRSKEDSHDYRYFPDPDLPPLEISNEWFEKIKSEMPELPARKVERYTNEFGLPPYDAGVLTQQPETSRYFEEAAGFTSARKELSNLIMTEVLKVANEKKISLAEFAIEPKRLAKLVDLITSGVISGKIAKDVFAIMLSDESEPEEIVKREGLSQISDSDELEKIITSILNDNPAQVAEYLAGKEKILGFFVGQVMKQTKGKANPATVNSLLLSLLKRSSG
ncbi:MAG: Asp-tRNA(Asn)/Glu-tRNA(Gln) amidotransferase subunit GatB [Ignavibacteriales bacterium]|nr:MAG: Asp-tRNA(Asn)/Glu-tRNA(Gln) amidotransferase subunit GatB [Ignavibacteriaceae bacterium]MBW7873843.1 Asp-tRNA(Asn)/Glu-tRNA(Gln) amidotransferase subunit GatB [Ignavibacteria bacterium]MCZ2144180.1 Asp-tRNA(Asn)/Glu-tRNA(Gln) amidotransferase subunit GatB [Ignavibacteriales bacterium]OQY74877.1 MAG: aspartyl/glutamyl-tRNA amidotransferase subunit B [Ignavibacteriales bacterium UTCHB3]MBV6445819.1 Aspartyl/glutamyl-tRNA(Asn/Gln) amidotransferase subunit B [Ignavibacteriaceae bacterium]